MNIIEKLETQFKGYYMKTLNLNEFIDYNHLSMILNNNIKLENYELYNYDELYNNEFEDLELEDYQEEITEILFSEDITPEEEQEILTAINNNDKETISLLNESISSYIDELITNFVYCNDIYQYYLIDAYDVELWAKYTNYPIYYDYEQDLYILGITHYGMSWDYFDTTFKKRCYI